MDLATTRPYEPSLDMILRMMRPRRINSTSIVQPKISKGPANYWGIFATLPNSSFQISRYISCEDHQSIADRIKNKEWDPLAFEKQLI